MKVKVVEKDVMDPVAETSLNKVELSPIPQNITKISFIDNTKPNADIILKTIQANINIHSIKSNKPAGAPITPDQFEHAKKGDVIILALGDCGSCTTWLILDAINFEREEKPTICICTHKFAHYARSLANAYGAGNLRIIEINHPIAGLKEDEVIAKTRKIIPQIKELLNISI